MRKDTQMFLDRKKDGLWGEEGADSNKYRLPINGFLDLVTVFGLDHMTLKQGVVGKKTESSFLHSRVAYREDIINLLENESNCVKGAATQLADRIWRGKGLRRIDIDMLRQEGVAEWKIDFLSGIAYLFNRAHGIAYCMQIWRLAFG